MRGKKFKILLLTIFFMFILSVIPQFACEYGFSAFVGGSSNIVEAQEGIPTGLEPVAPTLYGRSDGKILYTTAEMEYKLSTSSSYTAVAGTQITGLKAGTYYVRYTGVIEYATVAVPNGNRNQSAPEELIGVAPTKYGDDDGKILNTTDTMEYRKSTDTEYTAVTGTKITGLVSGTYYVRYAAADGYNAGPYATVTVPKIMLSQSAPDDLEAIPPTSYGDNDGKIINTTDKMEYKLSSASTYKEVTGSKITGLKAGTYYVRYALRTGYNASAYTIIKVPQGAREQSEPTGLRGIAPSTLGGFDGKITGTTILMEYKRSTASTYTMVTGSEIKGLKAGTYYIRYASKLGYVSGDYNAVTVPNGPDYNLSGPVFSTNGWVIVDNKWYYMANGMRVYNTWMSDSQGWCYLGTDGSWLQEGWVNDSHGLCYIRNGYWVGHATWAEDSRGWAYIGSDGYYTSSISHKNSNPLDDAAELVDDALASRLQDDIDDARAAIKATRADATEQAPLLKRIAE
ncbi:MAG: hypothetical protein AB9844_01370 [Clostridiaceae bacterium]